ncbi:outer membrane lipoprotein chaperone LolA [Thalassotalea euphylliae]|uniref:outer membrane lipoprotein chaperone LolA n=1 Tax=Thalassotalea euphylliae TaxID=1655234 RepID=UPI0015F28022|nr:outer membrane lipoprotein chaperone LolA [Thalassotalea euphylliae]
MKISSKVVLLSLLTSLLTSNASAADAHASNVAIEQAQRKESVSDDQAQITLLAKLAKLENLAASFTQHIYDVDNNLLQSGEGQFTLAAPNYVNWQTTSPEASTMVSDGETLWLFDPFIEQVTAYSLANSINNTPILLLTSNDESLWQQYEVNQLTNHQFKVTAKSEDAQVKALLLGFNSDVLSSFTIVDATGQHSEFVLANTVVNQEIASEVFSFTIPEGVLLDDQR